MLPHLSYLTLALAAASTACARHVNVARGKLNMIPKFSYDPETSKHCVWWLDNDDGSWTCSEVGRAYELSMVDFQRWNPILSLPCGTLNKTQSYCIAATDPRAAIDTVTVEVTRTMGWNTTRPRTSSSMSIPQNVTVALTVPTTVLVTITIPSTTTISVPRTVSERTTIPSLTTVSVRTTVSIPTTVSVPTTLRTTIAIPTTLTVPTTLTPSATTLTVPTTLTPLATTVSVPFTLNQTTTLNQTATLRITTVSVTTITTLTTRWWTWYETLATVTVPIPNSTLKREQIRTPIPHQPDMVEYCRYFHLMKRDHLCTDLADWYHISQADLIRWNAPREGVCEELIRDYYVCVGSWE